MQQAAEERSAKLASGPFFQLIRIREYRDALVIRDDVKLVQAVLGVTEC
ncbi:hypothetical protein ALO80_102149 [Pseudomonas caricapapayae]|nr:hypothetical protein ALO80_102149 [Pseudomonas caricapapayae]